MIKLLHFDNEMVETMRNSLSEGKITKDRLRAIMTEGKITMSEFCSIVK